MGYGDYYRGLYRDYYRDPFPHSLRIKHQGVKRDGLLRGLSVACAVTAAFPLEKCTVLHFIHR